MHNMHMNMCMCMRMLLTCCACCCCCACVTCSHKNTTTDPGRTSSDSRERKGQTATTVRSHVFTCQPPAAFRPGAIAHVREHFVLPAQRSLGHRRRCRAPSPPALLGRPSPPCLSGGRLFYLWRRAASLHSPRLSGGGETKSDGINKNLPTFVLLFRSPSRFA